MTSLPASFLDKPLAHRGLHDLQNGVPENSISAFRAAIDAGYGIELDVQLSADGQAMVFHDYDLKRLTGQSGAIQQVDSDALRALNLIGADEGIPTLPEVLDIVAGRVPLLIEIKDQDGAMGPNVGQLEKAVGDALQSYNGPIALMSFNPYAVASLGEYAPYRARGLATSPMDPEFFGMLPEARREELRQISQYKSLDLNFISHKAEDLQNPRVAELKAEGATILCWTVRSPEDEIAARRVADNITFEGYAAKIP